MKLSRFYALAICALATLPAFAQVQATRDSLIAAASSGNLDQVKTIVAANPEFVSGTESQTPLGAAVANTQVEVVRFLLEKGADANATTWGDSPLSQALQRYDDKWKVLAELLVSKGADVNATDENRNQTLLQRALSMGYDQARQKERVQWLLDKGADVNATNRSGTSTLETALANSNVDILKLVLAKADLKRRDDSGNTPLFAAVQAGKIEVIRALLERGAEINTQNAVGDTPLHIAARGDARGVFNPVLLKTLLDLGAKPNVATARGDLPLHLALRRDVALDRTWNIYGGDYPALADPNAVPRGLQLAPLIDKTDINKRDGGGFSMLALTIASRDAESRDLIRDRAPKVDATTSLFDAIAGGESLKVAAALKAKPFLVYFRLPDGATPLRIAALWGTIGAAQELVKLGADVNARDSRGLTPLHYALRNPTARFARRSRKMAEFLLAHKADPNVTTPEGDAPIHLAARSADAELLAMLFAKGVQVNSRGVGNETPLLILTSKNTSAVLYQTLLAKGANVNVRGGTGNFSPLQRAVVARRRDLVELLLARGANLEAIDSEGRTALALAVFGSQYGSDNAGLNDITDLLLQKGANVLVRYNRQDLLTSAVERGNIDLVKQLLATKKFSLKNSRGRMSFLSSAISNGRLELVKILLDAGANPNEADQYGRTPLQAASNNEEIKKLLTEKIAQIAAEKEKATPPAAPIAPAVPVVPPPAIK